MTIRYGNIESNMSQPVDLSYLLRSYFVVYLSLKKSERTRGTECKQLSVYKLEPRQNNKQANILRCTVGDVKWPLKKNSSNFLRN